MIAPLIVGIVLGGAPPHDADAPADPPAQTEDERLADELYYQAKGYFDLEQYARARELLAQSLALDHRPETLYALAETERRLGSCDLAIPMYERYLEIETEVVASAREHLAECRAEVATAEPPPPRPPPPDPPPPSRPWHRDVAGGVLLGVGAVSLATGIGLIAGAHVSHDRALDSQRRYREVRDRVVAMERAGYVVLGVGVALVVGAVIRYAVVARRGRTAKRRSPTASRTSR